MALLTCAALLGRGSREIRIAMLPAYCVSGADEFDYEACSVHLSL